MVKAGVCKTLIGGSNPPVASITVQTRELAAASHDHHADSGHRPLVPSPRSEELCGQGQNAYQQQIEVATVGGSSARRGPPGDATAEP